LNQGFNQRGVWLNPWFNGFFYRTIINYRLSGIIPPLLSLNQLLIIFNDKAIYDIFLTAVNKIGLKDMKEIMAEVLSYNMNLCLIVALFYVFNDDKDKDKISLRNEPLATDKDIIVIMILVVSFIFPPCLDCCCLIIQLTATIEF
jgi:hypothetical protein